MGARSGMGRVRRWRRDGSARRAGALREHPAWGVCLKDREGGCAMSLNYTHEVMYVTPGQEEPYMTCVLALMTKPGFADEANRDPQFGLWRTAEVSGEWPKVINIWESKSWQEKANSF